MLRRTRAVLAAVAFVLAAGPARPEVVNRIVATVDGEPITAHELERYGAERGAGSADAQKVLEALITDKILHKEAEAKGITIKDADVDAYVAEVKSRNRMDDARFTEALAAQGVTMAQYRERVRSELQKSQLVNREIRARVSVSPEEIERYYEANRDRYATGVGVTLRDILLRVDALASDADVAAVRAKAEAVRAEAEGGADFAKLAKEYSQGPGASNGGLLGTFAPGELSKDFERAVAKLKKGDVSPVVRTESGFHILKVDDITKEGVRPLSEVRDEIRDTLYDQELEKRFEDWLSKDLRERHSVEVLD